MAIERGRIDASEAGPRGLRDQIEAQTGFGYQASAIHAGSMFGNGSQTPLAFVFEKEMNMDYSKIYIDADCSMHELKDILSFDKEDIFGDENYVRVFVDRNDSTDAERREPRAVFSPAIRATFYLEVYTEEEGDTIEFKEKVAQFIIFLRKHWPYVVASCDFEDFIIEKTGWNWTEEKPLPPPMIDGRSV